MNKLFVRTLLAVAGFAALTVPAKAQVADQVIVKIPFEFVAAGRTFPAGEYKISRISDSEPRNLVLRSVENHSEAVILHAQTEEASSGDKAGLDFTTVGDQHVLSRIETADYAFGIAVPRAETLLAATHGKGSMAPGSSGSN